MKNDFQPASANGKICYLEIPARDIAVSSSFFRDVFGWNIRTRSNGHIAFDDTIGEVSGTWIKGRSTSTFAGLLIYIMVDDISRTLGSIVDHGGSIIQPMGMDAPELTARFSDPAGNIFGLYQEPEK